MCIMCVWGQSETFDPKFCFSWGIFIFFGSEWSQTQVDSKHVQGIYIRITIALVDDARPLAQRDPDLPGERGRARDLRRSQESFGAHPGRRLPGARALADHSPKSGNLMESRHLFHSLSMVGSSKVFATANHFDLALRFSCIVFECFSVFSTLSSCDLWLYDRSQPLEQRVLPLPASRRQRMWWRRAWWMLLAKMWNNIEEPRHEFDMKPNPQHSSTQSTWLLDGKD